MSQYTKISPIETEIDLSATKNPLQITENASGRLVLEVWNYVGKERGCKNKWTGVSKGHFCENCFNETGEYSYTMKHYYVHYDPFDKTIDTDYVHGMHLCKTCNCPGDWVTFCFKCKSYENK